MHKRLLLLLLGCIWQYRDAKAKTEKQYNNMLSITFGWSLFVICKHFGLPSYFWLFWYVRSYFNTYPIVFYCLLTWKSWDKKMIGRKILNILLVLFFSLYHILHQLYATVFPLQTGGIKFLHHTTSLYYNMPKSCDACPFPALCYTFVLHCTIFLRLPMLYALFSCAFFL